MKHLRGDMADILDLLKRLRGGVNSGHNIHNKCDSMIEDANKLKSYDPDLVHAVLDLVETDMDYGLYEDD